MLNVVNFGGGSYVLYAEVQGDEIDVDPEPYSDNFARPARLLPLEAKALVAAIDLLGDHLPEGSLGSARAEDRDRARRGPGARGPADRAHAPPTTPRSRRAGSHGDRRVSACSTLEYYKENEDEFTERTIEPYGLINGREGWYVFSYDLDKRGHAPLPARPHQAGADLRRRPSSRAPRSTRAPTSRAGRDGRGARLAASRESGSRPSARAGSASGASIAGELRDGAADRGAALRRRRVARPRDPAGGRRRRRARARRRARRRCSKRARKLAGKRQRARAAA